MTELSPQSDVFERSPVSMRAFGSLWVPAKPGPSSRELVERYRMGLEAVAVALEDCYDERGIVGRNIAKAALDG